MGLKYLKQIINEFIGNIGFNHSITHCYNHPYIHLIEITNRCNLNCIMCIRDVMTREKGFMELELFKKIIKENHKNMDFVYLQCYGEPLLHPYLSEFINYANQYHVKTGMHTNGLTATEEIIKKLLNNNISVIRFGLDSVIKKTYDKIRKGSDFDKVMVNIKNTIYLKKSLKSNVKIQIQLVIMNENKGEIEEFKKAWKGEEVEIIIINKIERKFEFEYKRKNSCLYGWRSVVIQWNGDVVPCCNDWNGNLILGNLKENTLKKIWNNEKYIQFRKQLIKGKIDFQPCMNCNMLEHIKPIKAYPFSKEVFKNIFHIIKPSGSQIENKNSLKGEKDE